jgi:succinate dehydrogenase / fumarate reductase membrane anchor subunit
MSNDPRSLRTELGRVRYLGAARSGTTENWYMRLTSAALVPLTIAFVWIVLGLIGKDYNAARAMLSNPIPAVLMLLFVLAGIYHMQLGMKSILLDYLHDERLKEWALILNICFAIFVGLACVYAILRIGFA